jgi:hypothetical protein
MAWGSVTARSFLLASVFGSAKRAGAPATLYFALTYEATSPDTVLGAEPTIGTGSYARVAITNDDALWTITNELATNDVAIGWPLSTAAWSLASCNQWAVFDASTAGTCWAFGELDAAVAVTVAGRTPTLAAGALDLTQNAV